MRVRSILAAAAVTVPLFASSPAHAGPPYCVTYDDADRPKLTVCAFSQYCIAEWAYNNVMGCVDWP